MQRFWLIGSSLHDWHTQTPYWGSIIFLCLELPASRWQIGDISPFSFLCVPFLLLWVRTCQSCSHSDAEWALEHTPGLSSSLPATNYENRLWMLVALAWPPFTGSLDPQSQGKQRERAVGSTRPIKSATAHAWPAPSTSLLLILG